MAIELPDDLIARERTAWTEIQEGRLTVAAALAVHEATPAFAAREDVEATRLAIEERLKRLVRHPEPEAAAA
ncbi:hypothetical protein OG698_09060 [Streptomyces sp. NBC_01003]|uniref:hypothetical protein n=1 Tax=Streptomyces sp. NBC_01003 TaxID=2903714 RepID=UPI00386C9399|nr:hypothetical protein OG698_09060 [Streptomyces sp. NBC_01003]